MSEFTNYLKEESQIETILEKIKESTDQNNKYVAAIETATDYFINIADNRNEIRNTHISFGHCKTKDDVIARINEGV